MFQIFRAAGFWFFGSLGPSFKIIICPKAFNFFLEFTPPYMEIDEREKTKISIQNAQLINQRKTKRRSISLSG